MLFDAPDWSLFTPANIQTRKVWPWAHSIQKFVHAGEPHPRECNNLLILSDFGGEHKKATHNIYCFLIVKGGARKFVQGVRRLRREHLPENRTMSYKALGDRKRQEAIVSYLELAADLDGHLVAIAVDKRKKWLSTGPMAHRVIRDQWHLKASWNARALEAMMRKTQMVVALLPLWSKPYSNVTWITDQDEFVANDRRHDDALAAVSRFSGLYLPHKMGTFALNITSQDQESRDFEDLCCIPDLSAGMLSEVATQLTLEGSWEDGIRRTLDADMPGKAQLLADWFWDSDMELRKTMISLDMAGEKYGVRKIWMEEAPRSILCSEPGGMQREARSGPPLPKVRST